MMRRRMRAAHILKLLRAAKIALAVLCAAAVALLFSIVPMRLLLPALSFPERRPDELRIHFLDVGQGDCTIVEFPGGDAVIVDGGDGSFEHNNLLARYIKGLAPASLTLIATHADVDHYGGLSEILRVFGADTVYFPALGSSAAAYRRLVRAAEAAGSRQLRMARYTCIADDSGAYIACISPHAADEQEDNDSSAVLYIGYGELGVLLCGDISAEREAALLREAALSEDIFDCGPYRVRLEETDLVKLAHHGSGTATSQAWLAALSPEVAIVSCGRGNAYRHPAAETLARLDEAGVQVYRTDEVGGIVVCADATDYTVYTNYTE